MLNLVKIPIIKLHFAKYFNIPHGKILKMETFICNARESLSLKEKQIIRDSDLLTNAILR